MADHTLAMWELSQLAIGANAFAGTGSPDNSMVGQIISFVPGATVTSLMMTDTSDDGIFNEGTGSQQLLFDETFNGDSFSAGDRVEADYSYIVRPVGSTDPADNITIIAVRIDSSNIEGIVSDHPLDPTVTYEIVEIGINDPSIPYDDVFVCFAAGTLIATPSGMIPVEDIRAGQIVQTADNGPREVVWTGQSFVASLAGKAAPIRFAQGAIGNHSPLTVSPQHRILVKTNRGEDALVAAKALVGQPGVTRARVAIVRYVHLLLESHELLFSNGALAESFNPGPQGWEMLGLANQRSLSAHIRPPRKALLLPPARPIIRVGCWRRGDHRLLAEAF